MKKDMLKYGMIAGAGTLCWFLLFYALGRELMLSPWVYYASFVFYLWAMYSAMRSSLRGGVQAFKEVLRAGFAVYLLANLVYYLFYYFINHWDPALAETQKEMMREWLPRITPKDKLRQALKALEESDFVVHPRDAFFSYMRSAIGGFVLAVGLAWLVIRTHKETI